MNKALLMDWIANPRWGLRPSEACLAYPSVAFFHYLRAWEDSPLWSDIALRLPRRSALWVLQRKPLPELPLPGRVSDNPPMFILSKVSTQMPKSFFPTEEGEGLEGSKDKNKKKRFKLPNIPSLEDPSILEVFNKREAKALDLPSVEAGLEQGVSSLDLDTEAFLASLKRRQDKPSVISEGLIPEVEASLRENEQVISESLAELLLVQGQKAKAIKMYQALALKFPEKSCFFAERIEAIKKI